MRMYKAGCALLLLLLTANGLVGCDNADAETDINKPVEANTAFNWSEVSERHTQGIISRHSPIRFEFNRDVVTKNKVGADASEVMSLSPKVAGSATFVSSKALVFVPKEPLESGKSYAVNIASTDLINIPASAAPLSFSVNVIPLEFEVRSNALIASADTGRKMNLTGELLTSDRVMPDAVKQMLTASFQNKSLSIDWLFDESGKR
ncbi:MAG: hypothetical protein ACPG47_09100, partial [Leucothrix sp.]